MVGMFDDVHVTCLFSLQYKSAWPSHPQHLKFWGFNCLAVDARASAFLQKSSKSMSLVLEGVSVETFEIGFVGDLSKLESSPSDAPPRFGSSIWRCFLTSGPFRGWVSPSSGRLQRWPGAFAWTISATSWAVKTFKNIIIGVVKFCKKRGLGFCDCLGQDVRNIESKCHSRCKSGLSMSKNTARCKWTRLIDFSFLLNNC